MSYSYTFIDAYNTFLKRVDADGNVVCFATNPANCDYAEFLSSGATAAPYVEPPAPPELPEPTPEEKLARAGLTVEELKGLLGLN